MTREQRHAEIDRRSDYIRVRIENGDWRLLEQLLASAPEAQRLEFYIACADHLLSRGAQFMNRVSRELAFPLQDAVALSIAERVDREMGQ